MPCQSDPPSLKPPISKQGSLLENTAHDLQSCAIFHDHIASSILMEIQAANSFLAVDSPKWLDFWICFCEKHCCLFS
jgi:hypothetical protein